MEQRNVIRDIYTSDLILFDLENEMMNEVDESYFELMEDIIHRIENHQVTLSDKEVHLLETKMNSFYFEYGFVQFKRGLELGLSMRNIH